MKRKNNKNKNLCAMPRGIATVRSAKKSCKKRTTSKKRKTNKKTKTKTPTSVSGYNGRGIIEYSDGSKKRFPTGEEAMRVYNKYWGLS
jgi:DNA replication protein DnaD